MSIVVLIMVFGTKQMQRYPNAIKWETFFSQDKWLDGQPTYLIWEDTFIKILSVIHEEYENLKCCPQVEQWNRLYSVHLTENVTCLLKHWSEFPIEVPFTQNILVRGIRVFDMHAFQIIRPIFISSPYISMLLSARNGLLWFIFCVSM